MRISYNEERKAKGLKPLPAIPNDGYADYMPPMILLSLNTGVRQGELFSLSWSNVSMSQKMITIPGHFSKSGKTRHISLNSEALTVLQKWKKYHHSDNLVFPNKGGKRLNNVKKAWRGLLDDAGIKDFRWHDMRHDFASKLVMAGVDLNTVRELMGHATIQMTLRYAHLAPKHKADAVERLVK